VSLALDVESATANCLAQPTRIGATILNAPEAGPAVDRDWLELLAELVAHPSTAMPCERIARMLCATFESTACSYSRIVGGSIVEGMIWFLDDNLTAPRIARPPRSGTARDTVGAVALRAWREHGPPVACPDRLPLPMPLSLAVTMAFVLGRAGPYRSAELRLAAALWTLLEALDRRIKAKAARELSRQVELTPLTPRELAVLKLLGDGLTAVAIAHRLRISVRTVHKHLERIYGKLGVNDRLAAVLEARRLGLVAS
jgi:DNA-binding CsgD family transcriptional regulator